MMAGKSVVADVVIPVYKPDDKFARLIKGLAGQSEKPEKLIIMYTRAFDGDRMDLKYLKPLEDICEVEVHELDKSRFDHGGTRAEAAGYSTADIMIMMTMDAVPYDSHLIEELTAPFSDDKVGASYARQMPDEHSSLAERFTRGFNYPDKMRIKGREDIKELGIKAFFCSNVCAAYRKEVYDKLGGFIKRTIFNEDMIFAHKLIMSGYKICYAAGARVIHTHEYTPGQQFHRNFDLAVSQAMHPEVFKGISSESEGVKYIKAAYRYFNKKGKGYLIIPFVYGCCFKYLGFLLGKNHKHLPRSLVRACAMNKEFFSQGGSHAGSEQQQ
ncbi:MAG: glycosyltransferase family 2 protein [Lachnospiraceae bacterium]|nr:glycosyltransferase family 2 protein [Lachnospiraceae bacterium]